MTFVYIAIAVVVVIAVWAISTSNNFKRAKIKIDEARSGIEVALTKRYDMLTKLLDVAKGYAKHEKEIFAEVINLRKGMSVQEMNRASSQIRNAIKEFLKIQAHYFPDLIEDIKKMMDERNQSYVTYEIEVIIFVMSQTSHLLINDIARIYAISILWNKLYFPHPL